MKTLSLILGCILVSLAASAQENNGVDISITVENILNDNGKVIVALHTADTFMKTQGIQSTSSSIEDGQITVTFKNVPEGVYAIMALHDENDNKRMDFEASGMPKESYGMSRNEMSMGPPAFADAQFDVTDTNLEFNIRF